MSTDYHMYTKVVGTVEVVNCQVISYKHYMNGYKLIIYTYSHSQNLIIL